jgi:hypothetical protein
MAIQDGKAVSSLVYEKMALFSYSNWCKLYLGPGHKYKNSTKYCTSYTVPLYLDVFMQPLLRIKSLKLLLA